MTYLRMVLKMSKTTHADIILDKHRVKIPNMASEPLYKKAGFTLEQVKIMLGPKEFTNFLKMHNIAYESEPSEEALPPERNKYMREILPDVWVDVYDVISAFEVTDGGMQHALKKILATGKRGHKTETEDRVDILESVRRSNEIHIRGKYGKST